MERLARSTSALGGLGAFALALMLGAAMAAAQPPLSLPFVLFLALPPLYWLLEGSRSVMGGFRVGWGAGVGYFGAALFWIVEPFQIDPEAHAWLAPFALLGMSFGLALFWGAAFALARLAGQRAPADGAPWRGPLLLAALLALAEFARSHLLTGFPWALVGYAWVETPVIQAAAVLGIHGLGLITLVAALLPAAVLPRGGRPAALLLALLLVSLPWGYGAVRLAAPVPERAEPFVVRLVQPNAPQHLKWDPHMQAVFYERHLRMTAAEGAPDVVVWSETAVPFVLGYAEAEQAEIAAAAGGTPVILGIRRAEVTPDEERWFNSLAILGDGGQVLGVYDKHHLVPFGEYVPFGAAIARLGLPGLEPLTRAGFTPGEGPHLLGTRDIPPFLPLICYEAIFPQHIWAPEGRPEWLVQVTNDAWFGTLSGPFQHFAQNRVRAIEQGLPLVRVANTGISAMIDPYGRTIAAIDLGEQGFVDAVLPAALAPTPYARWGEAITAVAFLLILLLTLTNFASGKSR